MSLLRLPAPVDAEAEWSGWPSRAILGEGRILVWGRLEPFDAAFVAAHELGHLFDHRELDDNLRGEFAAVLPRCDGWWGSRYETSAAEAFASAFAVHSCHGPWRGTSWMNCNWDAPDTGLVLATCRAVIEEARHRRALVART